MDLAHHLQSLEMELLDPLTRRNPSRLRHLLALDFLEFGSSGRTFTHDQILVAMTAEQSGPPLLSLSDFQLLVSGPDWALVTYRSHRHNASGDLLHTALRSSTWVLRQEHWRLRFHQGTKATNLCLTPERNSE